MEELTRLEERIMQCIWNYQGEVPFLDLIEMVKEKLNKDYKRTSIRGYLFRLEEKGYIKVTKKGRICKTMSKCIRRETDKRRRGRVKRDLR